MQRYVSIIVKITKGKHKMRFSTFPNSFINQYDELRGDLTKAIDEEPYMYFNGFYYNKPETALVQDYKRLVKACKKMGVSVRTMSQKDRIRLRGAYGRYIPNKNIIQINTEYCLNDRISVLAHELGHYALKHVGNWSSYVKAKNEWEAQTTAYLVMNWLGYPTLRETIHYLHGFIKETPSVIDDNNGIHIMSAASRIVHYL